MQIRSFRELIVWQRTMDVSMQTCGRHRSISASLLALPLLGLALAGGAAAQTAADIVNTKHNLSVSGPGFIRALTETRICVFCHTPHNAAPQSPLWNKELEPQIYTVYASPTLQAGPLPQPSGPTKLCLSCHDGTIAMGAVLNPAGGISMVGAGMLPPGSLSDFGLDLSGHHPVSFSYSAALPNADLASSPPPDLVYGGTDEVHCTTCHDPHDDRYGRFLLKDNIYSALCTTCHQMTGWSASAHATSTASVVGVLPRPPKNWPNYTRLNEWGCEACHTPHFAPTPEYLLNFTAAPAGSSCTSNGCHSSAEPSPHAVTAVRLSGGSGAAYRAGQADIGRQISKLSAHPEPLGNVSMALRTPGEAARSGSRSVACADCHNPHVVAAGEADAPHVSAMLEGVSGIDRNGAELSSAAYEYQICFKCHADNTPDFDYVPRVLSLTNTRFAFDPSNPSYHPVVSMGKNLNVPSIPSSFEPQMSPADLIYCTSCHADDEGVSRGPHGSSFAPILRERYETVDNTPESYDNYALCYRCHDRSNILSDASFRAKLPRTTASGGGHSGHLAAGAPCAACHDPHGVNDSGVAGPRGTGSHTHLINFATTIVAPRPGSEYPIFADGGNFQGSCSLVCHGVDHDNWSYP